MAEYTRFWKRIYAVNWIAGVTDFFTLNIWPMIMAYLIRETTFLGPDPESAAAIGGLLITLFALGNAIGGIIMAYPADRWGRKRTLQCSIGIYTLGAFLTGISPSWIVMAPTRFIEGIGNGGEDCARVPYVTETVPTKIRGFALGLMQASSIVGAILASLSAPLILATWADWRYVWFVGALASLIPIILLFFVPESKRWMETAQAVKENKVKSMHAPSKVTYVELFKRELRRTTVLAILLQLIKDTISWGVGFWLPTLLFVERKISYEMAGIFMALFQATSIIGLLSWSRISDIIGRKKVLYASSLLSCPTLILVSVVYDPTILLALILFGGFCLMGMATAVYTLASEWFPTRVRATGWGLSMSIGRIASAICAGVLPGLVASLGASISQIFMAFGICNLAFIPIGYAGVETAKKELEEISGAA